MILYIIRTSTPPIIFITIYAIGDAIDLTTEFNNLRPKYGLIQKQYTVSLEEGKSSNCLLILTYEQQKDFLCTTTSLNCDACVRFFVLYNKMIITHDNIKTNK